MLDTVDRLTCTDAVGVIGKGQGVSTVGSGCKLSAFLPCKSIAVVVIQRVADGIIGDSCALIRSQQIALIRNSSEHVHCNPKYSRHFFV